MRAAISGPHVGVHWSNWEGFGTRDSIPTFSAFVFCPLSFAGLETRVRVPDLVSPVLPLEPAHDEVPPGEILEMGEEQQVD